jgi:hypothetical protein
MGASVRAPYWGTRTELMEVLDLARAGAVHVEVEKYTLDEAPEAYRRLHEGAVRSGAVVVPGDRSAARLDARQRPVAAQRSGVRKVHRGPGASASLRSRVHSGAPSSSARATKAAS